MRQLNLHEGELAMIEYKSLPSATYAKFKPMSTDFLNISNPRAMLEVELRKFSCLTKGDTIAVEVCVSTNLAYLTSVQISVQRAGA